METTPRSGWKSSEFFALFAAHALVLLCPLVGYTIDPALIPYVLGLDALYITGRPMLKGTATLAGAKVEAAKVANQNQPLDEATIAKAAAEVLKSFQQQKAA